MKMTVKKKVRFSESWKKLKLNFESFNGMQPLVQDSERD